MVKKFTKRKNIVLIISTSILLSFCNKKEDVTTINLATIKITTVNSITRYTASVEAKIPNERASSPLLERGVCYSTNANPTIEDQKVISTTSIASGIDTLVFIADLSGLLGETTYHLRAYAINKAGTAYGDDITFTTKPIIGLGETYGGGFIFYIDNTGKHGLIAAPMDQSPAVIWGCDAISIPGTSKSIGTGLLNTMAIIDNCNTPNTAAKICYDLVLNGYDDWYLPSLDELQLVYDNLAIKGIENFKFDSNNLYWSSTEAPLPNIGSAYGIVFHINNGSMQAIVPKEKAESGSLVLFGVHAIRSF